MRTHPSFLDFRGWWGLTTLLVFACGGSLGGFVMESARAPISLDYLSRIGWRWVETCAHLPALGTLFQLAWDFSIWAGWDRALRPLALHFPGILTGGVAALSLWFMFSFVGAWQNCRTLRRSLRVVALCFLPLLAYTGLGFVPELYREWDWHWISILPFTATAFLLHMALRSLRETALGTCASAQHRSRRPVEDERADRGGMGSGDGDADGDGRPGRSGIALLLVWVAALISFLIWARLSTLRHDNFQSQGYDLALMSHILNRFIVGEGLNSSLIVSGGGFLGHHFSPILFLLSPLYYFGPHPETLLWVQAAAVAFAAIPFFYFAQVLLGSSWAACSMALTYLFLPGLSWGIYSDFHAIALAPPLFFWLAYEAVRGHSRRWWIPLFLLLSIQENMFIYAAGLGGFLLLHGEIRRLSQYAWKRDPSHQPSRTRKTLSLPLGEGRAEGLLGLALIAVSLVYAALVFGVIQPLIKAEAEPAYGFVQRYKDFLPQGTDPGSTGLSALAWEVFSHPGRIFSLLFSSKRLEIFGVFWGGVLFLPLWNPLSWVLVAPILENSLSSDEFLFMWGGHYAFGPVMVSALAMAVSLAVFCRWRRAQRWVPPVGWVLFFSSVLWWITHSTVMATMPLPDVQFRIRKAPEGTDHVLGTQIPHLGSVAAQSHLLPHLTHQEKLYLLPPLVPVSVEDAVPGAPEFEIIQPRDGWPDYLVLDRNAADIPNWYNLWFYSPEKTLQWVDWLVQSGRYRRIVVHESLEVLERAGSPR